MSAYFASLHLEDRVIHILAMLVAVLLTTGVFEP